MNGNNIYSCKKEYYDMMDKKFEEKAAVLPSFIQIYFSTFKSAKSKNTYYSLIKDFLAWMIKNHLSSSDLLSEIKIEDLQSVQSMHIIMYLNDLKKQGMKTSTLESKKKMLGSLWTFLVDNDLADKNIVHNYSVKKNKNFIPEVTNHMHDIKLPTKQQMSVLLANVSSCKSFEENRNAAIVYMLYKRGLRLNEVSMLNIEDIDFDDCTCSIISKGNLDQYDLIPIDAETMEKLHQYMNMRKDMQSRDSSLFITQSGKRISESAIKKIICNLSEGTITPHMLRHYCATVEYLKTKDLNHVKNLLRHKDVKTTERYTHIKLM